MEAFTAFSFACGMVRLVVRTGRRANRRRSVPCPEQTNCAFDVSAEAGVGDWRAPQQASCHTMLQRLILRGRLRFGQVHAQRRAATPDRTLQVVTLVSTSAHTCGRSGCETSTWPLSPAAPISPYSLRVPAERLSRVEISAPSARTVKRHVVLEEAKEVGRSSRPSTTRPTRQ